MEDINGNCNPSFEVDIKLNGVTNVLEQGLKGLDGQGFTMQGEWSENILYKPYDVVTSINGVFCCLLLNDNSEPTDENPKIGIKCLTLFNQNMNLKKKREY